MVRHDNPVAIAQTFNQLAVVEGPGGIPVQHDDGGPIALVDVMHTSPVHINVMGVERIQLPEPGDAVVTNRVYFDRWALSRVLEPARNST